MRALGQIGLLLLGCGQAASSGPSAEGAAGAATNGGGAGAGSAAVTGGTASTNGGTSAAGSNAGAPVGGANASIDPGQIPVDCVHDGDGKTTLAFVNGCAKSVSFRGSDIAGATLTPGAFQCVDIGSDVEALSAKRYWGFSGEDPGAEHHTLAELTFNTDFNDFDWYNISHVDAFNLPIQIVPLARPKCDVLTCADDWLEACPSIGHYEDSQGAVVACVSPERDNPDSPVARFFEACDDGYAWSGDDQKGTDPSPVRACAGEDWKIVFCPRAEP